MWGPSRRMTPAPPTSRMSNATFAGPALFDAVRRSATVSRPVVVSWVIKRQLFRGIAVHGWPWRCPPRFRDVLHDRHHGASRLPPQCFKLSVPNIPGHESPPLLKITEPGANYKHHGLSADTRNNADIVALPNKHYQQRQTFRKFSAGWPVSAWVP